MVALMAMWWLKIFFCLDACSSIAVMLRMIKHQVSWAAQEAIYNFMKENAQDLARGKLPCFKTIRRKIECNLPETLLKIKYLEPDGEVVTLNDVPFSIQPKCCACGLVHLNRNTSAKTGGLKSEI